MSVSLITQDATRAVGLNPYAFFDRLRGGVLTLDSLVVKNIRAESISTGDDALPDIYYYGQAPSAKLLGGKNTGSTPPPFIQPAVSAVPITAISTTIVGTGSTGNANVLSLNGTSTTIPEIGLDALIRFPSPLHYTFTTAADALNPYVSATIITAGTKLNGSGGAQTARSASMRLGLQSCTPTIALRQLTTGGDNPDAPGTAILPQTDGMWIALPLLANGTSPQSANGNATIRDVFGGSGTGTTAQVCWYIVGVAPGTPPSSFVGGEVVGTPTIENMTPYAPFPGTPSSTKFVIRFSGGLIGSAVQFPTSTQTPTTTTLGNFLAPDATGASDYSYPPVVFPVSGNTASGALASLSRNPSIDGTGALQDPPFTYTGGIWIQQLWWVSTQPTTLPPGQTQPPGALPGACYNVSHLFTNVGNHDNDSVAKNSQFPLNAATIKVGPRSAPTAGQDARDGAFDITINLPRQVVCAPGGTGNARMPTYANQYGAGIPQLPTTAGATFLATSTFGYWVCLLGTIATNGADITSVRVSDGVVAPEGQAGSVSSYTQLPRNTTFLGQLSQLPLEWDVADPNTNFTYSGGSGAIGGILTWKSTPVNPLVPAAWYTNVLNPAGLLTLVPPAA
jgi:hypothetical protein